MFLRLLNDFRARWDAATADILGADLMPPVSDPAPVEYFREHPHRASLGFARPGRPGTVATRPAVCLSPVGTTRAPHRLTPEHRVARLSTASHA